MCLSALSLPADHVMLSAALVAAVREKTRPPVSVLACGVLLAAATCAGQMPDWQQAADGLALAACAVGLPPVLLKALASLKRCMLDINVLMVLAVGE